MSDFEKWTFNSPPPLRNPKDDRIAELERRDALYQAFLRAYDRWDAAEGHLGPVDDARAAIDWIPDGAAE